MDRGFVLSECGSEPLVSLLLRLDLLMVDLVGLRSNKNDYAVVLVWLLVITPCIVVFMFFSCILFLLTCSGVKTKNAYKQKEMVDFHLTKKKGKQWIREKPYCREKGGDLER